VSVSVSQAGSAGTSLESTLVEWLRIPPCDALTHVCNAMHPCVDRCAHAATTQTPTALFPAIRPSTWMQTKRFMGLMLAGEVFRKRPSSSSEVQHLWAKVVEERREDTMSGLWAVRSAWLRALQAGIAAGLLTEDYRPLDASERRECMGALCEEVGQDLWDHPVQTLAVLADILEATREAQYQPSRYLQQQQQQQPEYRHEFDFSEQLMYLLFTSAQQGGLSTDNDGPRTSSGDSQRDDVPRDAVRFDRGDGQHPSPSRLQKVAAARLEGLRQQGARLLSTLQQHQRQLLGRVQAHRTGVSTETSSALGIHPQPFAQVLAAHGWVPSHVTFKRGPAELQLLPGRAARMQQPREGHQLN